MFNITPTSSESSDPPTNTDLNPQDYEKLFFEKDATYILADGTFARLKDYSQKGSRPKIKFDYEQNSHTVTKKSLGLLLSDLLEIRGKPVLLKEDGRTKLVTIKDITVGADYLSTQFVFDDHGTLNEELGNEFILEMPPFFTSINPDKGELEILSWLASEQVPVTIYTKDELEQGIDCTIVSVLDSKSVEIFKYNNPNNKAEIAVENIEGVAFILKCFMFTRKNQMGLGSRLGNRLFSRNKQIRHINA